MYYQQMQHAQKNLEDKIQVLNSKIAALPQGRLRIKRNGKYWQWVQVNEKESTIISKKNRQLAQQLALKTFYCMVREEHLRELKSIQSYFQQYSNATNAKKEISSQQLLTTPGEFQTLLSGQLSTFSEDIQNWLSATYTSNPFYPEQKKFSTGTGFYVRSKSEVMIAIALTTAQIPFRYECALSIGYSTIYPDFTILHPRTGEIFYWEHFGKMDDTGYQQKTSRKLALYISNQIIPTHQLITTYETQNHPLTMSEIDSVISYYFS